MNPYEKVTNLYRDAFCEHGPSEEALFWTKGKADLRFEGLIRHSFAVRSTRSGNPTVLDYGCGLADLKSYLDSRHPGCTYSGADLVGEFIEHDRSRWPDCPFEKISGPEQTGGPFDFIFLSGVFNLLYLASEGEQEEIIQSTLKTLFAKTKVALAVNFLTDAVDFKQPGAYHQNPGKILTFAATALTPRFVLDQTDMPYEYTLTLFKDAEIKKPANIFSPQAGA